MKSVNREAMFNVLTKVLSTDTIILHYKELDTALNAYYFFRDEFYAKSKKAPVIPEDEEDYWPKSPAFKEGRISPVEFKFNYNKIYLYTDDTVGFILTCDKADELVDYCSRFENYITAEIDFNSVKMILSLNAL